jgi:methyltransferase (TIGR00027 family)
VPVDSNPSFTALTAAAARAAHLVVDQPPCIFSDTAAAAVLGELAAGLVRYHVENPSHPILATARGQVLCRSRYTEDRVTAAIVTGVRQYVLLGAGLDTFAYRSSLAGQLAIWEVDHPATQAWKRAALAAAQIDAGPAVTFVPAEFGGSSLARVLQAGGFDFGQAAVISLLGVTMYLDDRAIRDTLTALSSCAPGAELIVDYMLPAGLRDKTGDSYVSQVAAAAADRGEPWLTFASPADMTALLAEFGFSIAEHVRQRDAIPAELWDRSDSLRPVELSMIARAIRRPQ